jgi:nitrite reductase/ring-hydroxylating ferredoxin subunit
MTEVKQPRRIALCNQKEATLELVQPGAATGQNTSPMIFLCHAADVPIDTVRRITLPDGKIIAVYNLGGRYLATDDRCTHGHASLADGMIEDGSIVCPLHFGSFDIETGEPTAPPCAIRLRTYKVVINGDSLHLN